MEIQDKLIVMVQFDAGGRSEEIAPLVASLIATAQQHSSQAEAYRDELTTKLVISITLDDRGELAALLKAIGPIFEDLERAAKLTRVQCFGIVDDTLREMLLPFGAEFFTEWSSVGA
jgi:hypothetical protein